MSLDTTHPPGTYRIRHFRADDRDQLLSLHASIFDREWGREWFRWKFEDNPYVDHVPIVVATRGDRVVGCRAFFALELRIDGDTQVALQPCDTMVHPDHRRRGLFSRMNELALEFYADRPPALCFNFPNENSKPGNLKHGWREIGTVPMYYRLQDPVSLVASDDEEAGAKVAVPGVGGGHKHVELAASGLGRGLALADALSESVPGYGHADLASEVDDLTVERYETPPSELLSSLYRREVPDGIHANRTSEFYDWRLENPAPDYVTYVARRDGEAVAAVVVSPVADDLRIVETLPRAFDGRRGVLSTLVRTVLAEYDDRGYVSAFGKTIPAPLRHRFYPDTRFPLSTVIQPTTRSLLARGLDSGTDVEARPIDDWRLTRLDLDTS